MIKSDNSQGYPKPPEFNFPDEKLTEIVTDRLRKLSPAGDSGEFITIEHQPGMSDLNSLLPVNHMPGSGLMIFSRFDLLDELLQSLVHALNKKKLFRIVILLSGEFNPEAVAAFFTSISSTAELEYFEKQLVYNEFKDKLTLIALRIKQ